MKITTAWIWPAGENAPWLISAYDELTADEWNGEPEFFTKDIAKHAPEGDHQAVRIIEINVPSSDIYEAWQTADVNGSVTATSQPES